ncbi:MAG: glycosyl transferase family 2 [Acidobacteria bacterium]|nr:MAG: glycosyl transferase family 2 [Verrucomicrobiota bacterium]PYU29146.1 MAG: glycosyl transferase family 2 [Acidobacteriota bacterium]PYX71555.1 MAG: glycosyl transferase family 2 [Acidobacteriota bacterium]
MEPLVSILIPAFNAQEWISDTLRSAVAQTWPRKEIIVVDDGSSDETLAIARRFSCGNVCVITQENQGAAAARNKAFSLCQGQYIQWLDADDLLAPDKISRQMEILGQCLSKWTLASSAWGQFLYRDRRAKFVPTALWCDLSPADWLVRKLGQNLHMQTATWLVSRELSEAAGPWNTALLGDDDGEYFCRILLACNSIRFVPEARVYYRASGSNSLSYIGRSNRKREAQWLSMRMHVAYLRSLEDSERVRAACVRYLQNWLIFFYPERLDIVQQAEEMAKALGGQLQAPSLGWKYSWIKALLGWRLAMHARFFLPSVRWSLARVWDKALLYAEDRCQV